MTKQTSREEAYNSIQELITSMKIKPGQSITENELADQLGLGRTPVREAMAKLESEGLISSHKGRKTVYNLTLEEIKEIFEVKQALEGAIASWAAERGTKAERKKLVTIIAEMKKLAQNRPEDDRQRASYLRSWIAMNERLHTVIFEMARCKKAEQIIRKLNVQWHRTRVSVYALEGRIVRSAKEHEDFTQHIINGDAQRAEDRMKAHLKNLTAEIENVMHLFQYLAN